MSIKKIKVRIKNKPTKRIKVKVVNNKEKILNDLYADNLLEEIKKVCKTLCPNAKIMEISKKSLENSIKSYKMEPYLNIHTPLPKGLNPTIYTKDEPIINEKNNWVINSKFCDPIEITVEDTTKKDEYFKELNKHWSEITNDLPENITFLGCVKNEGYVVPFEKKDGKFYNPFNELRVVGLTHYMKLPEYFRENFDLKYESQKEYEKESIEHLSSKNFIENMNKNKREKRKTISKLPFYNLPFPMGNIKAISNIDCNICPMKDSPFCDICYDINGNKRKED